MAYKMIMTSPYIETTHTIELLAAELGYSVTIVEDTMSWAAAKVNELVKSGEYEVVISRAGTAANIAESVDLPIVHCDNSDFDIMQAFIRAKRLGDRIGFLTYPEEAFPYKLKTMIDTIGFDVVQLPYRRWDDLTNQIQNAADMGIEVVVGGGRRAMELIKKCGMQGMFISTSERTIKRALIRASEVAQYRVAAREKAERLNAVIHVSDSGIILVNKRGQIETFNPAAEKMFGIRAADVIGNQSHTVANAVLRHLLEREEIAIGGSITTEDMVVAYEPIQTDHERTGTVITFKEISKIQQLENQIRRDLHMKGLVSRFQFSDIQYASEKMEELIKKARYFASTDSTVLIIGESGTGKELVAQGIHHASNRSGRPFVAINCAALPESLLESELFGYADGAFTGARKGGRPGVFELAHEGTIFLDEIGEISPPIQARLLRVLQEREVMRVGGDRVIPVNIRIIAATNRNLWQLVTEGKFRADLYFRLNVLRLEAPALRDRKDDIPVLVDHFLKRGGVTAQWNQLSERMRHFLRSYSWPGNIRELENIMERYRLSVQDEKDEFNFIQDILNETEPRAAAEPRTGGDVLTVKLGTIGEIEKQIYEQLLERFDNNRSLVAETLGISRTTLWKKMGTPS